MLKSATFAPCLFAIGASLAACSSGASESPPVSGLGMDSLALHVRGTPVRPDQPGRLFLGVKWTGHIHRDHRKSWISPDAKNAPRLLFASDVGAGDIYIFRLPQMSLRGIITGFNFPQGECSDGKGDVYVADTFTLAVFEYSRGGVVLNTYLDWYGHPTSCAVNPTNGALAVGDADGLDGGPGQVLIFSSATSTPTVLTNPAQYSYDFVGYDSNGNLWADGSTDVDPLGAFILSACGASRCRTINLSGGTIYFAGAVQWDRVRKTWVVFDQKCNNAEGSCSYPVSASGVLGTPTTYLDNEGNLACDVVQGVIAAVGEKYAVGADYDYCGSARSTVNRWGYPAGGSPTNQTSEGIDIPIGAAISTK